MRAQDELSPEARQYQQDKVKLERYRFVQTLQSAEDSLQAGEYDRAIAFALIDITKKLDMIAKGLGNLAESQRRIANAQAPRSDLPPYGLLDDKFSVP